MFSFPFTVENLLEIITTKVNNMMQHYDELNRGKDDDVEELLETTKTYQAAIIDDSQFAPRLKSQSFEFDF